ncbi:unnamed protein product [Nezara viridula]|uniref:Uncharacterized protein n=1 Tax=Nezara viridula TaxID=85310 RepID=A0A9P0HL58_NEZVI|nr:unnamed protein product [Nezara viridula]
MMLISLVAHMKLKRAMLRPLLIKIPPNQCESYLTAGGLIGVVAPFPLLAAEAGPRDGGVGGVERRVVRQVEVVVGVVGGPVCVVVVAPVRRAGYCVQAWKQTGNISTLEKKTDERT